MEALESVLSLIVTLGILVTIHEFGHYWVARRCGVKVLKFSVGFGKPLYTWTNRAGTDFCVAAIPLGGYVRMLDEREGPVPEQDQSQAFNNKPVSQRIAIASAGPIANFLFAILAYWLMSSIGFNVVKPIVGEVEEASIAAEAGLVAGQEIVKVDGRQTQGWRDVNLALINFVGETAKINVEAKSPGDDLPVGLTMSVDAWLSGSEQKDLLSSLGIRPERPSIPATLGVVQEGSPAAVGGLKSGDLIVQADGQAVEGWFSLVGIIERSAEKKIDIAVERLSENGAAQRVVLSVTPELVTAEDGEARGRLGIGVAPFKYPEEMIRSVQLGPIDALVFAADQTWSDTVMTLNAIRKMLVGLLSLDNLSGPITIAQVASQSISSGVESFLSFLAILSVSLGVLNLLPIPVLDGGHILYYLLEAVRGKPLPESWQVAGLKIGISFVVALMAIAFYNDIMRL